MRSIIKFATYTKFIAFQCLVPSVPRPIHDKKGEFGYKIKGGKKSRKKGT